MFTQDDDHPGSWITLMSYAAKKDVSLSTLRRYIKSNKLTYKIENGRYLIWDGKKFETSPIPAFENHSQVQHLERELLKAQEEIAELKTLIAFYEESTP